MGAKLSAIFRFVIITVTVIISAALMLYAATGDSAIVNEPAHITAGYSYVRFLDYRLNPENPPLVKAIAAIPLLFQNLNFPIDSLAWQQETNGQAALGGEFLYESGNNADQIILGARIIPIIFALILIVAVYFWSKELMGRWWALLPAFLAAFSPNILAHGHYVTTDIGTTLAIFLAIIAFLKFLESPSKKRLFLSGLALGFAQLTNFSALILIPYFLVMAIIFYVLAKRGAGELLKSLLTIFAIGFALVFAVYFIFTINYPIAKQVSDAETILGSASDSFIKDIAIQSSGIPVLRAIGEYLLGAIISIQPSARGNAFLKFLSKEPPASLIIVGFALLISLWGAIKAVRKLADHLKTYFAEFAMLVFVIAYWLLNENILPAIPLIYILSAGAIKTWFSIREPDSNNNFVIKIMIVYQELLSISVKSAFLGVLLVWYAISPIIVAPHFLSYFNFLSGGSKRGYDLGQDLKRLAQYVERVSNDDDPENDIDKIAVDYFGGGNPKHYLGESAEIWLSARGNPNLEDIRWLAVSISRLAPGEAKSPEDQYLWLTDPHKPHTRAGTSIFIYKL